MFTFSIFPIDKVDVLKAAKVNKQNQGSYKC